mgnify:CR=1 FL=1
MQIVTAWEQTPYFEPNNPNQIMQEHMVGTGGDRGYASFYWNQVPVPGELFGPGLGFASSKLGMFAAGAGLLAVGAGIIFAITAAAKSKAKSRRLAQYGGW